MVQQALSCTGKPAASAGTIDIYVAPASAGGDDSASGTCAAPLATLKAAHDKLPLPTLFASDYRIWVRGGVYQGESFDWTRLDLGGDATVHKIAIESYPGEVATFDGEGESGEVEGKFIGFERPDPTPSADVDNPSVNVSIRRIHVTNYGRIGIGLYHVGGVAIEDSWFTNIGNRWWEVKFGLGALHMGDADNCIIRNNVFSHIENVRPADNDREPTDEDDDPAADITLVHVAYIHDDADRNIFENNYVEYCSGDPFKTRNDSDRNQFLGNLALWSGHRAFLNTHRDSAEAPSVRNVLAGNVALFPHPEFIDEAHSVNDLSWCTNDDCTHVRDAADNKTPYMDTTGYLYPFVPAHEDVTSATQADVDNDGIDELFVVFRYPGHAGFVALEREGSVEFEAVPGLSLVLRTDGSDDRVLRKVAYKSDYWTEIPAIAGGNFVAGGADEVITAFQTPSKTLIYRGNGLTSLTNQATLYTHESASPTRVTALAGGNFKTGTGYEGDEIAVAIKNSDNTEAVWRGTSTTLQVAELWNNTASPWTGFNVGALAAVNPDSTAAQEIAASFHSSAATYLLWKVNGSVSSHEVYADTSGSLWRVRSLVSTPDSGFDELYAGMEYWNVGRTYHFSDLVNGGVTQQIYSSTAGSSDRYWDTPAMARRSLAGCTEVVSILSGGDGETTRVYAGTKDSISAFGTYYRTDVAPSTEPAADRTQLLRRTRGDTIAACL